LFITKAKKSFTHVQLEQCYAQKNRILGPQDRKPAKLILSRPCSCFDDLVRSIAFIQTAKSWGTVSKTK
jgi:hypothetical protein